MSSEQEMLLGRSSLCPERSSLSRVVTGTPAYGTPPHVNTSQHVTPNDHYEKNEYCGSSLPNPCPFEIVAENLGGVVTYVNILNANLQHQWSH